MKAVALFAVLALFAVILLGVNYVHMRFFRVDVVLYSALLDAGIAALLLVLILLTTRWFTVFTRSEKALVVIIALLCGYIYAISIPTVIDRSLSFYILEKIQQRGGGIRQDSFQRVFTDEYLVEHRLVDVRLTEQQESGTISIANGCVKLTSRGVAFARFSRFFRKNFLPRRRLLMGKYSDSLTDPFRNSRAITDYRCQ